MTDEFGPDTRKAIRSFSGTHSFRLSCVLEVDPDDGDYYTKCYDLGLCPRCERPLPTLPVLPSGSRVTRCRCVPICGECGTDESFEVVGPDEWPLEADEITERVQTFMGNTQVGILSGGGDHGPPVVIDEDGSHPIHPRENPGGWAQYGFDEDDDGKSR
jgi:hypothetical protein